MNGKVLSIAMADLYKPKTAGAGMGLEMSENMCEVDDDGRDQRMAMGPVVNLQRQVWAFE
jgi:hypothetical protein